MNQTLLQKDKDYIWHPYTQMETATPPVGIVAGEGALLFDVEGRAFIDGISSWWTNLHGHANAYIAQKIQQQALRLDHVLFAGFTHPPAVALAERLLAHLPDNQKRIFYSDNGSTAVEVAIKMAIQFFYNKGKARYKLLAFEDGFHGETFGAMSASGDHSLNNPFKRFMFDVHRLPTPTAGKETAFLDALDLALQSDEAMAFIFEPLVLGTGGMLMYAPEVLNQAMARCKAKGVICIADEVMTGFYRTGTLFATHQLNEKPDIICLSKGLTGGALPLGVTSCSETIFEAFLGNDMQKALLHGHSYTGNPIACAAALASLDLLEQPSTLENLKRIIEKHTSFIAKMSQHPAIEHARQCGTIAAVTYKTDAETSYFNPFRDEMYRFFMENGAILRPLGNVAYIMPPYCTSDAQLDRLYELITQLADAQVR